MNPATKKPKGTAFVEFDTPAAAQKAAEASQQQRDGSGPGISIKGQTVVVDVALEQESARTLAKAQSKVEAGKSASDKRNLYLLKEGFIEEGSALWDSLSAGDQAKRRRAAQESKLKLKSPNFFVSPTRLHVINIPASWDEKRLKEAARQAVLARASQLRPKVKQAVILRDAARLDDSANAKSRGIGFVEFETHEQALVCLRQLNNNPTAFGSQERRPIVEFAIENVKILKIRDRKIRLQQEQLAQRAAAERAPAEDDVPDAAAAEPAAAGGNASELDAAALLERGLKRKARNDRRQRERRLKFDMIKSGEQRRVEPAASTPASQGPTPRRSKPAKDAQGDVDGAPSPEGDITAAHGLRRKRGTISGSRLPPADGKRAKRARSDEAVVHRQSEKAQLDSAIDKLASGVDDRGLKKKKRKLESDSVTEKSLDQLVAKRTRALFGLDVGPKKLATSAISARWFE